MRSRRADRGAVVGSVHGIDRMLRNVETGRFERGRSALTHAAAATPNLRHLEWFHDHVRIESLFFEGTPDPAGGAIHPDPSAPGLGLTLRTADAAPYRIQ